MRRGRFLLSALPAVVDSPAVVVVVVVVVVRAEGEGGEGGGRK